MEEHERCPACCHDSICCISSSGMRYCANDDCDLDPLTEAEWDRLEHPNVESATLDIRDRYDEEGHLEPRDGDRVPTRTEFANLLQRIAEDAGANAGSVAQPLAERFAQFLDAIYDELDGRSVGACREFSGEATDPGPPKEYNVRDCPCGGAGYIESDFAPGTFYPCSTCNPNWARVDLPTESASFSESLKGAKPLKGIAVQAMSDQELATTREAYIAMLEAENAELRAYVADSLMRIARLELKNK